MELAEIKSAATDRQLHRIFVAEEELLENIKGFDHVVSLAGGNADSYGDEYLGGIEDLAIYGEVYDTVHNFLSSKWDLPELCYQGVDLLLCFRKAIFIFTYRMALRHETLRNIAHRFPGSTICLERGKPSEKTPKFWQLHELSSLLKAMPIELLHSRSVPKKSIETESRSLTDRFWPSSLSKGNCASAEVLIYADMAKSVDILKRLGSRSVLYCSEHAPKWFTRSWIDRFSIRQTAFPFNRKEEYEFAIQAFNNMIDTTKLFAGLVIKGLKMEPLLTAYLRSLFHSQLGEVLFHIDAAHKFLGSSAKLRAVFLDEDTNPKKNAFCQVAKLHRLRTYVECHGSLGHKAGYLPLTADYIFAWGRAQKSKLMRWGCDASRIIVSGCSRYQKFQELDFHAAKRQVAKSLHIDPAKKIVLVGFTPLKDFGQVHKRKLRAIADAVFEAIESLPSIQFIWKIHPGDRNRNYYFDAARQRVNSGNVRLIEHFDPLLLARASDLMVVYRSTFAIDGFALGKKVICIYDGPCLMLEEFEEFGIFSDVHELKRIKDEIVRELERDSDSARAQQEQRARRECLNLGERDPASIITEYLLSPIPFS